MIMRGARHRSSANEPLPIAGRQISSIDLYGVHQMTARTIIRVVGASAAEATREAGSLRGHLLDVGPGDLAIDLIKEDKTTQDMGATLVLALGAPAVVAIAHGIADWLRRRRIGSTIELEIRGNRVRVTGEVADNPAQLEGLIRALTKGEPGA